MDLGEKEREQLKLVDLALRKISKGDYGLCEECGDPIPPKRLEVVPYARLCVTCQGQAEQREKMV
jgi:DnaK suppressor protein